jgi:Tfp pilus assembly protein PilE
MRHPLGLRRSQRGFSDVHLALVIAVVASLAVGGVAGVQRYMYDAQIAEPRNALFQIAEAASRAYQASTGPDGRHKLCTTSSYVPADATAVRGESYQSSQVDWNGAGDNALAGWRCLRFEIDQPQRFRYHYESAGGGGPGASYVVTAEGDLDGDGTPSRFSLHGVVDANDLLRTDPDVREETPYEK